MTPAPSDDLRRRYPLYAEAGLAGALLLAILAFTVPVEASSIPVVAAPDTDPLILSEVPQTAEAFTPPPPPPAPPPPVEVPDDVEVVDDVIQQLRLPNEFAVPPSAPSAPVVVAPPPTVPDVEPPTLPPVVADEDVVFTVAEVQPELIGGLAALQAAVEYPEFARRAGIEGQVVVQFVVDERGNVVDPVVLRSPNELLSEAALEAVRASRFTPGQQRGRPVKVRFAVPVTFRLR
ncbi:energy transducer TonB [Rubrivirga sp.]|uniref:energy transducer TonB n=2 Tax=Rubrivirga sp. TaxID=1885344 RepID=UPI003C790764